MKLLMLLVLVLVPMIALGDASPLPMTAAPAAAPALSLWAFTKLHWAEIGGAFFTLLFFASEYVGQNPNIKANNVFQLVQGFLKAKSGVA